MTRWLGVDPGGSHVGIVLRDRSDLVDHMLVERVKGNDSMVPRELIDTVLAALRSMRSQHGDFLVAVEDISEPRSHIRGERSMLKPRHYIGVASVLGAVLAERQDAVLVPPGGNGSAPLAVYPQALRPTRGKGSGTDRLRHCRSAWDVSVAGPTIATLTRLSPPTASRG